MPALEKAQGWASKGLGNGLGELYYLLCVVVYPRHVFSLQGICTPSYWGEKMQMPTNIIKPLLGGAEIPGQVPAG